ncbi:PREDICTED: uncharacterized protein LOC105462310, partial [Wasmannia auropunctata]|uniref:uncharacterized protein LOC105462310 n=1 Tax=Wasmannia auropunctata TaxID=64793 RepID=UPI0005EDAF8B
LIYCTPLVNLLITSLERRFSNLFEIVEEGKEAAVAAATHPQFKMRWLKCLHQMAQDNAMAAIKNGLVACYHLPSQNSMKEEMDISNDGFDFDNDNEDGINIQRDSSLRITAHEIEFQRFCQEQKKDLSILNAYPIIKSAFLKFNTLLPSSAPVEKMFSFAT